MGMPRNSATSSMVRSLSLVSKAEIVRNDPHHGPNQRSNQVLPRAPVSPGRPLFSDFSDFSHQLLTVAGVRPLVR